MEKVLFAFLLSIVFPALGIGATSIGKMDPAQIHQLYRDGEFSQLQTKLTEFEKTHSVGFNFADSVLVARYLGVIFCANPETRERGRGYFFRLFALTPDADLAAMLVSEDIDKIFEKVRKEFRAVNPNYRRQPPDSQIATVNPKSHTKTNTSDLQMRPSNRKEPVAIQSSPKKTSSSKFPWLTAGLGAAAIGAGVTTYIVLSQPAPRVDPEQEVVLIPKEKP